MSIEKINALKASMTNQQSSVSHSQAHKEEKITDNKLSESAKFMIGTTALASIIAVGIIGHKCGWWGKAQKAASQLTSGNTQPASSKAASNFDIMKTQLENGYALFCKKTGKVFNKTFDPENNECRYIFSRPLENGNMIEIKKENIQTVIKGKQKLISQTTHSIINKDRKVIYETSYEKGSNLRPEIIFDYNTMTAYQAKVLKNTTGINVICTVKSPFEIVGKDIKFKEESYLDYTEFEKIRQKILDENLPASYNRIKSKFLKQFRHEIKNGDNRVVRQNNGTRMFSRDLGHAKQILYTKKTDGTATLKIGDIGSPNLPYCFRIDKLDDGKLVEFESTTLPDGRLYRKIYDKETNQYIFERLKGDESIKITEEEFIRKRNYAIANVIPDGITSKIDRNSSFPKNSNGDILIRHKDNEFEIREAKSGKKQYSIILDDDGKIGEYSKFDENGHKIEFGENYSDFCTFNGPNGKIEGSYEECGLNKFIELIKDVTGILD